MPVRPRDAASLVLLRGEGADTEVLLGKRASSHRFMPDVWVFPGGAVEARDRLVTPHSDLRPPVRRLLERHCSPARARALATAAVRETFEETGLALGARTDDGLRPALSKLDFVARAITPTRSPTRYHARFFTARANEAAGKLQSSRELPELGWFRLEHARTLRIIDVTAFVLETIAGAPQRTQRVPLYSYRRGKGRVRWD